jgi:Flp pilus assembly pilin Flp
MNRTLHTLRRLMNDEFGGANAEYAVVAGLILVAVIAVLAQFGPRVLARWATVGQKLGDGPAAVVSGAGQTTAAAAH